MVRRDNKQVEDLAAKAQIRNNKVGKRHDDKKPKDPRQEIRARQDNKKAAKLAAEAYIKIQRLLCRVFFLAIRLIYFLTFLS